MKKELLYLWLSVLVSAFLIGCGNSDIKLVKNGTMDGFETTTVGKAFEASFTNPQWKSFESKKGERVVQFDGNISEELHNSIAEEMLKEFDEAGDNKYFPFSSLAAKYGSEIPSSLPEKYGITWANGGATGGSRDQYFEFLEEGYEIMVKAVWKTGTPVEIQWVVTPNGKSFNLKSIASNAWEGLSYEAVLKEIYR